MATRRIIIIASCVLVGVLVGITPSALQFFAERQLLQLQHRGVRLRADGISGFLLGVAAAQVEGWLTIATSRSGVSTIPLQLRAEDVRISAGFSPLNLQLRAHAEATIYAGRARATIAKLFSGQKVEAALQRVDLSIHPQLRAFGLESGIIDATMHNHPLDGDWSQEATYSISLDHLELLAPAWLQAVSGISQVSGGQAVLRATVKQGGRLSLQSSNFDCSLGSGTLQGTALLKGDGEIENINASVRFRLDRPDSDKVGRWLPVIVGSGSSGDATSFMCSVRSTKCGTAGAQRIGKGCVAVTCAE